MQENRKVLVISGPTATGKTALGVETALRLNGEVISADSMQIYRGMDIGTAKIKNGTATFRNGTAKSKNGTDTKPRIGWNANFCRQGH